MSNPRNVLVTGGAGFIGSQLVRDLLAQGYRVTALDDFSTGRRENIAECLDSANFKFVEGSICSSTDVDKALADCDAVLHLAVSNLRVSISRPRVSHDVNATGTFNVLEAARKQGLKRFVYVSSSEIYGSAITVPMSETHPLNPTTVYASSKLAGEYYTLSYAKMYGMNATVVRPFNNYGPRSHFERENGEIIPRSVTLLMNGRPPVLFGDGSQTRDFTYVSDTAKGLIQMLEKGDTAGEIFNLATGIETTMKTICEKLCQLIDPSIKPVYVGTKRPGDVSRHMADTAKIRKRYGIDPATPLDEGLKKYVEWFRAQKYDLKALLAEVPERNW